MQRIAILYTPAGGGHRAAANAIAEELRRLPATYVEVKNVLEFAPRWFAYDRTWRLIQRHGTHAWDWGFDASERFSLDALRLPLHRALFTATRTSSTWRRPTSCARTTCRHSPSAESARSSPRA
jgi:hypothetical protein